MLGKYFLFTKLSANRFFDLKKILERTSRLKTRDKITRYDKIWFVLSINLVGI